MRLLPLLAAALIGAAVAFGAAFVAFDDEPGVAAEVAAETGVPVAEVEAALGEVRAEARRVRAGLERIRPPRAREEAALRPPVGPRYAVHLARARALGVGPVGSEAELQRLLAAGRLVPLVDGEFYTVKVLEHSSPFVTPETIRLLEEIGRRFQGELAERGLPRFKYTISSATRTAASQAALGEINPNAAVGRSSHEYGTCVDIVYTKYQYAARPEDALDGLPPALDGPMNALLREQLDALGARYWEHLSGLMARVLGEMQDARDVVVLLESRQPVFHITLWNPVGA